MVLKLTPRTELEAVNTMLQIIGEQPVNTLDTSGLSDASIAQSILHNVSREVQSLGLHCNSEEHYSLLPDVDNGYIYLPENTLFVDASDKFTDVVSRGNKLYDRYNHTFVFKDPVEVDIVFFLDFEDLPQTVREYITIKAGRQFQTRVQGSDTLYKLTEQDEQAAWVALMGSEINSDDSSIFDSFSTSKIIDRTI